MTEIIIFDEIYFLPQLSYYSKLDGLRFVHVLLFCMVSTILFFLIFLFMVYLMPQYRILDGHLHCHCFLFLLGSRMFHMSQHIA